MGYVAFGNEAPGNLLTGFGFYNPYWLVDFANACITVHLVGAYQVKTKFNDQSPNIMCDIERIKTIEL